MYSLDRRRFLRVLPAGLFGMSLARLAAAAAEQPGRPAGAGKATRMILLWLGGAPSTIDMWDPKPDAPDDIRGEFRAIPSSVHGVQLCEHLSKTARILNRCTLVRSLHHNIPEHGPGAELMLSGHLPSPALQYPSIGSVAARMSEGTQSVPQYVAFDQPDAATAGYLGAAWNALELDGGGEPLPAGLSLGRGADRDQFARRVVLRNRLDRRFDRFNHDVTASSLGAFYSDAAQLLKQDTIGKALDTTREASAVRERYGTGSSFGGRLLQARRLIEAGCRFVTVGLSGWDTHDDNFGQLRNRLLPALDSGLSTLVLDLETRGLLDTTVVCCCGEFGRTPHVNGSAGRDHWSRAFSALVAGGGFGAGLVYGATDRLGGEPIADACTPADFCATLLHALGIDPKATTTTSSGRPLPLIEQGSVMHALFG